MPLCIPEFSLQNARKKRADERTRTADLLITSDNSGVAEVCRDLQIPHIWAVFSSPACSVLHGIAFPVVSSGVNIILASAWPVRPPLVNSVPIGQAVPHHLVWKRNARRGRLSEPHVSYLFLVRFRKLKALYKTKRFDYRKGPFSYGRYARFRRA